MKYEIKMEHRISKRVYSRIQQFYYNVILKYPNTYSYEDAERDKNNVISELRKVGISLIPSNTTLPKWKGYSVCRSKLTNWYFAYKIQNDIVYVYDAENGKNMSDKAYDPL